MLRRFNYRQLPRPQRGPVLAYLQRLSGYSRAQITRLVSRWTGGERLVKEYRAPEHAFARRYTAGDVALLAEVDRAMNTLSGPATACVLRHQRDVFGDVRFARLGSISIGHLYNLRNSAPYRAQRVVLTKSGLTQAATIGVCKAPAPEGRPGSITCTARNRFSATTTGVGTRSHLEVHFVATYPVQIISGTCEAACTGYRVAC